MVEARDRVGGRVWTIRDGFRQRQHAEAGADLIEGEQEVDAANWPGRSGLHPVRILRVGVRLLRSRPARPVDDAAARERDARHVGAARGADARLPAGGRTLGQRHCPPAGAGSRWLTGSIARTPRRGFAPGCEDCAVYSSPTPKSCRCCLSWISSRQSAIRAKARCIGSRKATIVWRRSWRNGFGAVRSCAPCFAALVTERAACSVSLEGASGRRDPRRGLPRGRRCRRRTLRDVTFDPELPDLQREAFGRLRTGAATRLLVQVSNRFWKQLGTGRTAFGTDQPTGAVWDGNEQQPGPPAVLSFLAGGHASRELQDIVRDEGLTNVLRRVDWLRRRGAKPPASSRRAPSSGKTIRGRAAAMRSSTRLRSDRCVTGSRGPPGASSLPANTRVTGGRDTSTARSKAVVAPRRKWPRIHDERRGLMMRKSLPSSFEDELTRLIERWLPFLPRGPPRGIRSRAAGARRRARPATRRHRDRDDARLCEQHRDEVTGLVRRRYCLDYLRGLLSMAPDVDAARHRRDSARPGSISSRSTTPMATAPATARSRRSAGS